MAITAVEELQRAHTTQGTVLTIGTFDGVHRGHRYVVSRAVKEARTRGFQSAIVTFRASPRETLRPDVPMLYLTSLDQRIELLKGLGVDVVVALTFDRELAQLSAKEFVGLLREYLILCHLVVGPDFALGHRREGTIPVLIELGTEMGFTVESLPPFLDGDGDEERISSSAIRKALTERGDVSTVERMLGRPHSVTGPVIRGYNRGKNLGFPTANVAVSTHSAVPADGVYVTKFYLDGTAYPSVTNVGDNPTFGNAERSVEVHILDFDRTIYGAEVRIEFLHRLRGEERFPGVDALVTQIGRDVEQTRTYFR